MMMNIYTATIQYTLEYGAITFGMMAPSNIDTLHVSQNQGMLRILVLPRGTSAKMMRHELHMLHVEHRAKLRRAKLYQNIRGNTKHQLHDTINRRQRNGWTTEIQEIMKNIYAATIHQTLEYGEITLGMMAHSNIDMVQVSKNQGMRRILGIP